MKKNVLERIVELGGNIDDVEGKDFTKDILSIKFDTVLYQKPVDTPWAKAEEQEPINGLGEFVDKNKKLFETNKEFFYEKIIDTYFCITKEYFGQIFWEPIFFTPFEEGTEDYDEWFDIIEDGDLSEIVKLTNNVKPEFIRVCYNETYLKGYYICTSDPNKINPTLFSIDLETMFTSVENEGKFENFLYTLMTKGELLDIVRKKMIK